MKWLKDKLWVIFSTIIVIITFIISISISIKSCNSGKVDSDYKEVCIRGHVYYRSNFLNKMGLSLALDDNGKPISCEIKND